jgi:DNA-binding LacI/PurR family transcriptional regulator
MIKGIELSHSELKDYKIEYDISLISGSSTVDEVAQILEKYNSCDGVILSGMSSPKYASLINEFYKINKNIVQVQSVNLEVPTLFGSKHNEAVASGVAADFLYESLRFSARKNILLFTGELTTAVHAGAAEAFARCCDARGMTLLSVVEMRDSEEYFERLLPDVFSEYSGKIDGIYITSGISSPLCRYIEKSNLTLPLVAFDTHDEIKHFMEKGIISAAISQNVTNQMKQAFDALVKYIISGDKPGEILYTDINLMLKSNMHQFE